MLDIQLNDFYVAWGWLTFYLKLAVITFTIVFIGYQIGKNR